VERANKYGQYHATYHSYIEVLVSVTEYPLNLEYVLEKVNLYRVLVMDHLVNTESCYKVVSYLIIVCMKDELTHTDIHINTVYLRILYN